MWHWWRSSCFPCSVGGLICAMVLARLPSCRCLSETKTRRVHNNVSLCKSLSFFHYTSANQQMVCIFDIVWFTRKFTNRICEHDEQAKAKKIAAKGLTLITMPTPQEHLWLIVFYEWRCSSGATSTSRNIDSALGGDTTSVSTVNRWFARIEEGVTDFKDRSRSERPG